MKNLRRAIDKKETIKIRETSKKMINWFNVKA